MEKGLVYGALAIAILMLLVFLLDLIIGVPFGAAGGNPFTTIDVFGVLASAIVAYLAINASRDLK